MRTGTAGSDCRVWLGRGRVKVILDPAPSEGKTATVKQY